MIFTAQQIVRIIRGVVGVVLFITGVLNDNWIALVGIFLFAGSLNNTCGCYTSSCAVKDEALPWKASKE